MAAAAATETDVKKMVTLKSSDGVEFEVEAAAAMESQTLRNMIEDDCADSSIPLDNVTSKTLSKVIEYCRKHAESAGGEDLKAWDAGFVKVDHGALYELIMAANYLDIKSLLDLICQTVADMIKGKTPDEIRKTFGINNDFTPEEYDVIQKENHWAFD